MYFGIIVVCILYLVSLFNLTIAILGLFSKFRATAVGTLLKVKSQKNVPTRSGFQRIPVITSFKYSYIVNGKQYFYSSDGRYSKSNLYQKVTMVYVKGFPRFAYPNRFKGTTQWFFGILTLFTGTLFLVVLVLV